MPLIQTMQLYNNSIGWLAGEKYHFKGDKYCFKNSKNPLKTLYTISFSGLGCSDETWKLEFNTELERHKRKRDKKYKILQL